MVTHMEFKTAATPLQVKAATSDAWEVEGLAATWDLDDGGDRILPTAFDATLASGRKVKFLFSHDDSKVLGPPLALQVTRDGLFAKGRISKTTLGQDVHTLLKDGALDSWSIGYLTEDADTEGMVRILKRISLLECSLVAVPMNPRAIVTGVKNRQPSPLHRRLASARERLIRYHGIAPSDATVREQLQAARARMARWERRGIVR
jgi:HK97 family phage prohead protease